MDLIRINISLPRPLHRDLKRALKKRAEIAEKAGKAKTTTYISTWAQERATTFVTRYK